MEWISVIDKLPDILETVWISNGKGWTNLGCRSDLYEDTTENGETIYNWCWCETNGVIYESDGKIVAESDADDLDVRFWHPLPIPIKQP